MCCVVNNIECVVCGVLFSACYSLLVVCCLFFASCVLFVVVLFVEYGSVCVVY